MVTFPHNLISLIASVEPAFFEAFRKGGENLHTVLKAMSCQTLKTADSTGLWIVPGEGPDFGEVESAGTCPLRLCGWRLPSVSPESSLLKSVWPPRGWLGRIQHHTRCSGTAPPSQDCVRPGCLFDHPLASQQAIQPLRPKYVGGGRAGGFKGLDRMYLLPERSSVWQQSSKGECSLLIRYSARNPDDGSPYGNRCSA